MKTKIIALLLCLSALFGFASCQNAAPNGGTTSDDPETTEEERCQHVFTTTVVSEPTCRSVGKEKITCSLCGEIYYSNTFAEHIYVDGVCTVCGDFEPEFTPVHGGHYAPGPNDAPYFVPDGTIESYCLTGVGNNTGSEFHVPEMYKGKMVTSIGSGAFAGCVFDKIYLPHGLTSLKADALDGVTASDGSAPEIILDDPDGAGDFIVRQNCLLKKWSSGEYTRYVETVGRDGNNTVYYSGGKARTSGEASYAELYALLPGWTMIDDGSVREIGKSLFAGSMIDSITIPDGVVAIGQEAFANCPMLKSVVFPEGLTYIGFSAFSGDAALKDVTFPDSLKIIGNLAFSGCASLDGLVFGTSLSEIGDRAFLNCTGIRTIETKSFLRVIGFNAFENNTALVSLKLEKGVNALESYAFKGCRALEELYIGTLGKGCYYEAFPDCPKLHRIRLSEDAETFYMWHFLGNEITEITGGGEKLTVENGRVIDRENGILYAVVGDHPNPLEGVKEIAVGGFSQSTVKKLLIPGYVLIEENAFVCADGLEDVVFEDGLEELPSMAFQDCKNLRSVTLPSSLRSVCYGAFKGCSSLQKLEIPMGVNKMEKCLTGCTSLHTLTLPSTLTSFDNWLLETHPSYGTVPLDTLYYLGTEERFSSTMLDRTVERSFGKNVTVVFKP